MPPAPLNPSPVAPHLTLAQTLDQALAAFGEEKWADARPGLTLAAARRPQEAELHVALGITCFKMEDFRAAGAAFSTAARLSPGNADILIQLAMAHVELGEVVEAEKALREAVGLRPDDVSALKLLAGCCEARGDAEAAKAYNRRAKILEGIPVMEQRPDKPAKPHGFVYPKNVPAQSEIVLDIGLTLDLGACTYIHGNRVRNPSGARTHLIVGKFSSIASDLAIVGYDHKTEWISTYPFLDDCHRKFWPGTQGVPYPGAPECGGNTNRGNITIGNDVWIGFDVKLFKGVTIGDGAVVGACSLVNKDVPPYTIVAGTPARPLRKRFTDDEIAALRRIAWWEWPVEKINHYMPYLCSARIAELEAVLAAELAAIPASDDKEPTALSA